MSRRAPVSLGGVAPCQLVRLGAHTSPITLQRRGTQETPAALHHGTSLGAQPPPQPVNAPGRSEELDARARSPLLPSARVTHFKLHLSPSHFKQHRTKQVSLCTEEDIDAGVQGANSLATVLLECGHSVLPHSPYASLE